MEWLAKSYGSSANGGSVQRKAEVRELSGGAVVSDEELAHVEQCLRNPAGPSQTILQGQVLLQKLKQQSR